VETQTAVAERKSSPPAAAAVQPSGGGDALADPLQGEGLEDPLQQWSGEAVQADGETGGDEQTERTKEGTAEGLANYEATLGKWLGPKIYKAIAPHLTLDKMADYADQAFTGGLTALVDQLGNLEGEVDEAAIDKFNKALVEQFGEVAGDWLEGDGKGFAEKVAGWVDTHPGTIVTIALLAAAGAIAADMDIPTLKHKLGITDNLSAELEAKLGSLRNISLQSIEATLKWQSEGVSASVTSGYDDEAGTHTHGMQTTLTGDKDTFSFTGEGTFKGNDLELWSLDANFKHFLEGQKDRKSDDGFEAGAGYSKTEDDGRIATGLIRTTDGDLITTHSGNFNLDTGLITLTDSYKLLLDSGSLEFSKSSNSDGDQTNKLGYENDFGNGLKGSFSLEQMLKSQGVDSAYDLDASQKMELGLSYSRDWLTTELDAVFDSAGDSTLSGKLDTEFGGGFVAGGQGSFRLNDPRLTEMGAYFGFRSSDEFTTFLGRYQFDAGKDSHTLSVLMEKQLGVIYGRIQHSSVFTDSNIANETSAHAGYFFDDKKDVGIIGGATYQSSGEGDHHVIPQLGMQIKGVPLLVGYDIQSKGWTVGLTLPFGRRK